MEKHKPFKAELQNEINKITQSTAKQHTCVIDTMHRKLRYLPISEARAKQRAQQAIVFTQTRTAKEPG